MNDFSPFLRAATYQQYAAQVLETLSADGDEAFLLWKAYLKRIKPVPAGVAMGLTKHMAAAIQEIGVKIEPENAILVADLVGEALWRKLTDDARQEWLLKAI